MNLKLCFFAVLMVAGVFVCANQEQEETLLIGIVKLILIDPEFLALSDYDQIKVLEAIYTILESSLKKIEFTKKPKYYEKIGKRSMKTFDF